MLIKVRLTVMVVFSAVIGYVIAAGGAVHIVPLLILSIGGLCVAGAANAINQVIEKDYDALMSRTADRPVAAGRMQTSEAVVIAGIILLCGIVLLALFNPLTAFLGMLSFILYAFLYTPMKRYGTLSVAVGAIPGALPVVIGCVAYEGTVSWLALTLFAIQFLWQFPHFWAIGFLAFDQYRKAGFRLVPVSETGEIHPGLGWHTMVYTALLLPVCGLAVWSGIWGMWTAVMVTLVSAGYLWMAVRFYKAFDQASARSLMFASFVYLPVVLLIIMFGTL
jgi:heme o synthase